MKGVALFVWFALAGLASIALFNITFKVEQLQEELNSLNKQILEEQKAVHVLQAEWGYLARPERIEALAHRLLPYLHPPGAHQVGDIEHLQTAIENGPMVPPAARPVSTGGVQ